MRRWGDKKGSANTLVLPHGSGAISEACVFVVRIAGSHWNLPQGCVPPLLRHLVVIVLFACVRYLVVLPFHAYLNKNSDINGVLICF